MKLRKRKFSTCSTKDMFLLALPGIVWLIVFCYWPMYGVIIAFKDFNYKLGMFKSKWIGLQNFDYIFKSIDGPRIIRNTVLYNLMFIVIGTTVAVGIGILLFFVKKKILIKMYQTSMFLPYFISWIIAGSFVGTIILDYDKGILNKLVALFQADKIDWFMNPAPWPIILLIASLWKGVGYSSIIYFGAINGIDTEIFESTNLDGCKGFKLVWYIIVPIIKPMIIVMLVLSIGGIFRADFGLFFYMTRDSGTLFSSTDVIDTYAFRMMRVMGNMSIASAVGFLQSFMGVILVLITNALVKKYNSENALI